MPFNWYEAYNYCKSLPSGYLLYFDDQYELDDFKIISNYEIQMETWVEFFYYIFSFDFNSLKLFIRKKGWCECNNA